MVEEVEESVHKMRRKRKHIAKPMTASEIIKSLHLTAKDKAEVKKALERSKWQA